MFESRLIQNVRQRLADLLTQSHTELGNGSQVVDTADGTGLRTARYVGRIEAYKNALKSIEEIEREMSEKKRGT